MKNKVSGGVRAHRWDVTPAEAVALQAELGRLWIGTDRFRKIRTVAGLDAAFLLVESQALAARAGKQRGRSMALREANRAIGCVVMYRYPKMEEIERAFAILPLGFPYIPGLLSFRETPVLLAALRKLKAMPDLLFCDGQGIAHPRRLGLATHLGIVLDRPSIGCAKSILIGIYGSLGRKAGSWSPLIDARGSGERIGAALRTREAVQPVFVSQGNRVSLRSALQLTLGVADGFRIPRPTREADRFAGETKQKLQNGQLSEK